MSKVKPRLRSKHLLGLNAAGGRGVDIDLAVEGLIAEEDKKFLKTVSTLVDKVAKTSKQVSEPRVYNKHHKNAPPNAVYVGRGSRWGNPFVIGQDGDRDEVCDLYERRIRKDPAMMRVIKSALKGRDLVCFCKPARCHADFLLKIANGDKDESK